MRLALRLPEWILLAFYGYICLLIDLFPDRPNLRYQPLVVFALSAALFWTLSRLERLLPWVADIRDWLPLAFTFVAFREMELFLPKQYTREYELAWIRWDQVLLHDWHLRAAIESFGKLFPFYFELCYLLVYGVAAYSLGIIATKADRRAIDWFWAIYLTGTLCAYGLFPYFPSQPPRYAFPAMEPPTVTTWARTFNLWVLQHGTIHCAVFPSAHVSSAFSAAWALFTIFPKRRWLGATMLFYAISVSIATIYGRYHYAVDAAAGFGVSLTAAFVCLAARKKMEDQNV